MPLRSGLRRMDSAVQTALQEGQAGNWGPIISFGALWLLVELVKWLIQNKDKKSIKADRGLTDDEHAWLKELHAMHDNRDDDGVLKWWVPRSWGDIVKSSLDTTKEMHLVIKRQAEVLEKMADALRDIRNELRK